MYYEGNNKAFMKNKVGITTLPTVLVVRNTETNFFNPNNMLELKFQTQIATLEMEKHINEKLETELGDNYVKLVICRMIFLGFMALVTLMTVKK
jgi:hypothetical protein